MILDHLTFIKRKRDKLPTWITALEEQVIKEAKDTVYYHSVSYGDAKFDLKEKDYTYHASGVCNRLQLVRYDWYDRYGAPYGQSMEGAKIWFDERRLPAPEDYLHEIISKEYPDKYSKIFDNYHETYTQHIDFTLRHPKQDFAFMFRKYFLWLFELCMLAIPIGSYLILRDFLVEPNRDLFGQKYYDIENRDFFYTFIVFIGVIIMHFVIKDYHRGRLRIRNNKHALYVMGIPLIFYIVASLILMLFF